MAKLKLKIKGMHCPSCITLITEALEELGVKSKIDLKTGNAELDFDEKKVSKKELLETIKKEGYSVE